MSRPRDRDRRKKEKRQPTNRQRLCRMSCDVGRLSALGEGRWAANAVWNFAAPACCSFGHVGLLAADVLARLSSLWSSAQWPAHGPSWMPSAAPIAPSGGIMERPWRTLTSHLIMVRSVSATPCDSPWPTMPGNCAAQRQYRKMGHARPVAALWRRPQVLDDRPSPYGRSRGHAPPWHIMRTQYRLRIRLSLANAAHLRMPALRSTGG